MNLQKLTNLSYYQKSSYHSIHDEWTRHPFFNEIRDYLSKRNITKFIDLGANFGYCSKFFLEKCTSIKEIWAFEPEPLNFKALSEYLSDIDPDIRLNLINKAISYTSDFAVLCTTGDNNCGGFMLNSIIEETKPSNFINTNILVETTNIENIIIDDNTFIKIDIEGSEYDLLEHSNLLYNIRYILVELHSTNNDLNKKYKEKLSKTHRGYSYLGSNQFFCEKK